MALTDNIKYYYKMDGNSNDATGTVNGTDTSMSYASADGKINQGGHFSGSGYVQLSDVSLGITTGFTITAWVKTNTVTNTPQILNRDSFSGPSCRDWQFYISTAGKVGFIRFNSTPSVVTNFQSTGTVNDNNWHFVCAVFDNAVGSKIYIDGSQDGSDSVTTNNNDATGVTPVIGAGHNGNPTIQNIFTGSIDEVGFWTRGLSASEITSLYNSGAGLQYPFTPSNTSLGFFNMV